MSRLLSASELSRDLRVPISAILRQVHAGKVKPVRVEKALIFNERMARNVSRLIGDSSGTIRAGVLGLTDSQAQGAALNPGE